MGAPEGCKQHGHVWVQLYPWLQPGGGFKHNGPRNSGLMHLVDPRILVFKADFSARVSYRCPSILIAYSLKSGYGQSHECGKHGCVKF